MKEMTKEEWIKESRFLYLHLKEVHEHDTKLQIALQSAIPLLEEEEKQIVEANWKVYCIEKNIKPEDYEYDPEW